MHLNGKKENDGMDVDDNKQQSMEIVDDNNCNTDNVNNSDKANDKKVCAFKMEAVINNEFKTITDNNLNDKWSIMYFYGHDFEKAACDNLKCLNKKTAEFKALDTQIICVSTDSHYAHLAFIQSDQPNGLGSESNFGIILASDLST